MDEKKINIEGEEEVKQNAEASEETIVNEEKDQREHRERAG